MLTATSKYRLVCNCISHSEGCMSLTLHISRLVGVADGGVAHFGEQSHPLLIRLRHLEVVTKATDRHYNSLRLNK